MYGYVVPDTGVVSPRDFGMYRAAYCGMCIQLKKEYGNLPRYSVNYDMTFFTLLAIEASAPKLEFESIRCIGSPAKKTIIKSCDFLKKICDINILLFYAKLKDDEYDSGKKAAGIIFEKAYNKAVNSNPGADSIINHYYGLLRSYEKENGTSVDRAADSFACMLRDLFILNMGDVSAYSEGYINCIKGLTYNLGKYVYICDAVDDVDEDYRKGSYNPVLLSFPGYDGNRQKYYEKNRQALEFAIKSCIYRITENFNGIKCTQVEGILKNIIYLGLSKKAEQLLNSRKKLKQEDVSIPKKRLKEYHGEWEKLKREKSDKKYAGIADNADNGDNK